MFYAREARDIVNTWDEKKEEQERYSRLLFSLTSHIRNEYTEQNISRLVEQSSK